MRIDERPESPPEDDGLKIRMSLNEHDIFKLILEFLETRGLQISQLDVERESGVVNAVLSDDLLFLRQLILDGQWDDVLQFIEPLRSAESFDAKQFTFLVMKHQYLELLCNFIDSFKIESSRHFFERNKIKRCSKKDLNFSWPKTKFDSKSTSALNFFFHFEIFPRYVSQDHRSSIKSKSWDLLRP